MNVLVWTFTALTGLVTGSFLNVVIRRLPQKQSLVWPPSHCPSCGHRLSAAELIPLLSFFWLKGRCRHCRAPISPLYPLVELSTAVLFLLALGRYGFSPEALKAVLLASLLLAAACSDLLYGVIPNKLVGWGALLAVMVNVLAAEPDFLSMFLGALAAGGPLLAIGLVSPRAMGGGDVKLSLMAGLYLGPLPGLVMLFLAAVSGGLAAAAVLLTKNKGLKDTMPFGPYLALGGIVAVLAGQEILNWYLSLF